MDASYNFSHSDYSYSGVYTNDSLMTASTQWIQAAAYVDGPTGTVDVITGVLLSNHEAEHKFGLEPCSDPRLCHATGSILGGYTGGAPPCGFTTCTHKTFT